MAQAVKGHIPRAYRYYRSASIGGGIALLQILKMLEPFDLTSRGFNKAVTVNLMAEAEKIAYADRSKYIGDPSYIDIPVDTLLDEAYLRKRFLLCNAAVQTLPPQ
ncbi:MAG: gamma-glutamyltransferase [Sphingobacteriales bacterium JAD_PAG50586_3]|nr:MAG: gamma-glutamyltransferase [Sphingobacteriales bacterium JAD_PAG50586_3]